MRLEYHAVGSAGLGSMGTVQFSALTLEISCDLVDTPLMKNAVI
jgi:hypothetical protein